MPLPLDRQRTAAMTARFAEAADLVESEFHGLDAHRQYRNAFARVLKWDPLGRVAMMGTDQRDMFVPVVAESLRRSLGTGGSLFDVGCGDGQSFALLAGAVPDGTRVHFADPDPGYVAAYGAMLARLPRLAIGGATAAAFDAMDEAGSLPPDGSLDAVLALHMIYFVADPLGMVVRLVRLLRPGGVLVVVVADEAVAYGALAFHEHAASRRDDPALAAESAAMASRIRLFGDGGAALKAALAGDDVEVTATRQQSRLYGHSLADMIALANIANLASVEGTEKFAAPLALLRNRPEAVDLRIEDDGPRHGMLSVAQPQVVATIRRR